MHDFYFLVVPEIIGFAVTFILIERIFWKNRKSN